MSTTLAQLQTELVDRGTDYLNNTVAGQTRLINWLNDAYLDICERQAWPFLEVTLSSVNAPYTFTDLGRVLSVVDTTTFLTLEGVDRRVLTESWWDPTMTGSPLYWFLEGDVLKVYPLNTTDSLEIRYSKIPAALVNPTDTVVLPDRFTNAIVDGAMVYAHRDDDNYDLASQAQAAMEQTVAQMTQSLMNRNLANPGIIITRYSGNY